MLQPTLQPLVLPPRVRCNRGVGWAFWLAMGFAALATAAGLVAHANGSERGWPYAGIALAVVVIAIRLFLLPSLEFETDRGEFRTRRGTRPYAAIARVEVPSDRSGMWVRLVGDDGTTLARMSVAHNLFAPPRVEQWAALRHAIASSALARGASLDDRSAPSGHGWPVGSALAVLDAQIAWQLAGNGPGLHGAPIAALRQATITIA